MNGKLNKLLVKEGDLVHQGDLLGYMDCIGDPRQVTQLMKSLSELKTGVEENNVEKIQSYVKTRYLHLGEMQQHYRLFMQATMQFSNDLQKQKPLFLLTLSGFESTLKEWCRKYILQASVSGRIYFPIFMRENRELKTDQTVCFIEPGHATYYVEIYITQNNLGKIKIGQAVLLKFSAYPYKEYGTIKGIISFISGITTDSGYLAKVILAKELSTNYQKQIYFREGLTAQAEVIIENRSLLERLSISVHK
jgi:multidrug resistance efflux pump